VEWIAGILVLICVVCVLDYLMAPLWILLIFILVSSSAPPIWIAVAFLLGVLISED